MTDETIELALRQHDELDQCELCETWKARAVKEAQHVLRLSREIDRLRAVGGEAELVYFAQSAIEEVSDSWMYRATLHAQWACFYCNAVVEWVGDDGDEAVCEHFPDCLHLRARALRDSE